MRRTFARRLITALVALVAAAPLASAQFGGFGGGTLEPTINSSQLDRITDTLGLDSDQIAVARDFLAGYQTEHAELAKEQEELFENARREFRENRDPSVWRQVGRAAENIRNEAQSLEDNFFEDLQLLLNETQMSQWPTVQRDHRRSSTIERGMLSGEAVDLVDIVQKVAPDADDPSLAQGLESYANDLDRAIVVRNERYEDGFSRARELFQTGDFETIQELFDDAREAGLRVRDINERYARQLSQLVPADARDAFEQEVKERSYPRIYRRSFAGRAFDTVGELTDLTDAQKEQIDAIRDTHNRQAASINKEWEDAIREQEEGADVMSMMRSRWRGGQDDEASRARAERRELDKQTVERIRDILTPDQADKLPEDPGNFERRGNGRRGEGRGRGGRRTIGA